jgi:hypothetical protein
VIYLPDTNAWIYYLHERSCVRGNARLVDQPVEPGSHPARFFPESEPEEDGPCEGGGANGSAGAPPPDGREPGSDAVGVSVGAQGLRPGQNECGAQNDLATTDLNGSPGAVPSTENLAVAVMIHPESGTESGTHFARCEPRAHQWEGEAPSESGRPRVASRAGS